MRTTETCGCKHDGRHWLALCAAHQAEFDERHLRAQKEKDAADLLGCYYLVNTRDQSKQE